MGRGSAYIILIIVFLWSCAIVLAFTVEAAEDDCVNEAFAGHIKDCFELDWICEQALAEYYGSGKMDSLALLADIWYNKCWDSYSGDARRIYLLLAICDHRLDEFHISKTTVGDLMEFADHTKYVLQDTTHQDQIVVSKAEDEILKQLAKHMHTCYNLHYTIFQLDQVSREYDSMTVHFARALLDRGELSKGEQLICRVYAADTTAKLDELMGEQFRGTRLQKAYISWQNDLALLSFKLSTGLWVPAGPRSHLGIHPTFGFGLGVDWFRSAFYLAWNGYFVKTEDSFVAIEGDRVDTVGRFLLNTAECQFEYKFWRRYPNEFLCTFATGVQWLRAKGRNISSLIGAVGLSYRFYSSGYGFGKYTMEYYGIESRIEFSRMNTQGGTDLAGVGVSIRIFIGWGDND